MLDTQVRAKTNYENSTACWTLRPEQKLIMQNGGNNMAWWTLALSECGKHFSNLAIITKYYKYRFDFVPTSLRYI